MSYLLQGSGALLAPCFGSLGRELTKFAPCICIRCSRLIEIERGRGPLQNTRSFTNQPSPTFPLPSIPSTSTNLQYIYRDVNDIGHLRRQFPSDNFRQKYFTSFQSQLPLLGSTGPIAVNLNFTCAPDIPYTGEQLINKSSWKLKYFLNNIQIILFIFSLKEGKKYIFSMSFF